MTATESARTPLGRRLARAGRVCAAIVGAATVCTAQSGSVLVEVQEAWLLPDITHPWESAQPMSGSFTWSFAPGAFDDGSGEFMSLDLPWFGDDLSALDWTIETSSIEIVLDGNFHDFGVDVTMRLQQPLSIDQSSTIDLATSQFEIEVNGINRKGHFVSGVLVPRLNVVTYCYGDGSGSNCPCDNAASAGAGCLNSTGNGATLGAEGSASTATDDLLLRASDLPPAQAALAFCGSGPNNGGAGSPFGDGLLCVSGGIVRLGITSAGADGGAVWGPSLGQIGAWNAGATRSFQCWYRDPQGGPCGSAFNLSNGLSIVFTP